MCICRFAFSLKFWNIFAQNVVYSDFNKSAWKRVKNPHFNVDKRYRIFVRRAVDSICTMACNNYERTETMLKYSLTLIDTRNCFTIYLLSALYEMFSIKCLRQLGQGKRFTKEQHFRSSRPEVFCKKGVLENSQNSHENTCDRVFFLINK